MATHAERKLNVAVLDLKKQFRHLYEPRKGEFAIVEVPPMSFLMVDGSGDPNTTPAFQEAVEALYGTAYAIKFSLKKVDSSMDFVVPPLEGLWWADDLSTFHTSDGNTWKWTLMIAQPEAVTENTVRRAIVQMAEKKKHLRLSPRFEVYEEGRAIQTMHMGPFSEEGPIIERMHASLKEKGYELRGKHHEIYLSDPRRTRPEKLRTVLRQPVV